MFPAPPFYVQWGKRMLDGRIPTRWRRSTRCVNDSHCAEVAECGEAVYFRNSTEPSVWLVLTRAQWRCLLNLVRVSPGQV